MFILDSLNIWFKQKNWNKFNNLCKAVAKLESQI